MKSLTKILARLPLPCVRSTCRQVELSKLDQNKFLYAYVYIYVYTCVHTYIYICTYITLYIYIHVGMLPSPPPDVPMLFFLACYMEPCKHVSSCIYPPGTYQICVPY